MSSFRRGKRASSGSRCFSALGTLASMKLNYSLNSGFSSGDGNPPTRDNTAFWIAWVPLRSSDLTALGTTAYLTPRTIPSLDTDTILCGTTLGTVGAVDALADAAIDPVALSYTDSSSQTVELSAPLAVETVEVVVAQNGPARRAAQAAFADVPGERQFHIIAEFFE